MELTSDIASSDASRILNEGLPAVPLIVTPGPGFAAARWVGREYGALLHLRWDPDTPSLVECHVETYRRSSRGWVGVCAGGHSWWTSDPIAMPSLPSSAVEFGGSVECGWVGPTGLLSEGVVGIPGICGTEITWIEVDSASGIDRMPLESSVGAFVVAHDIGSEFVVRLGTSTGWTVATRHFGPLDFRSWP